MVVPLLAMAPPPEAVAATQTGAQLPLGAGAGEGAGVGDGVGDGAGAGEGPAVVPRSVHSEAFVGFQPVDA